MEIKEGKFYLRTAESTKSFTKGKVYKSPKDCYLADNNGNLYRCKIDAFTDKIVVHTPTKEDWNFVIGKVRKVYYNKWNQYGKDTSIDLSDGCYCTKGYFQNEGYHLITIDQFRAMFKEEFNNKVYIRGHKTRGNEVRAKLESLGCVDKWKFDFSDERAFFFLGESNEIDIDTEMPNDYTEIFLDEPVAEEPKLTKEQVELKVVEYAKSVNWDYEKIIELLLCRIISEEFMILDGDNPSDKAKKIFDKYKTTVVDYKFGFQQQFNTQKDFKTITDSISSLLEYKNSKYGNAALQPLDIFNGKCKVGQRLDDKLARIKNSGELRKNDVADLIGYLILTCKENNWTNFDEFKD